MTAPPLVCSPAPDDGPDYLCEDDLRALGIDPALVPALCPWAVELVGHGGVRCWATVDLAPLLGGTDQ